MNYAAYVGAAGAVFNLVAINLFVFSLPLAEHRKVLRLYGYASMLVACACHGLALWLVGA